MTRFVFMDTLAGKHRYVPIWTWRFFHARQEVRVMPKPSLQRLFTFAREHQLQARSVGDELRDELWNAITDQLIDRCGVTRLVRKESLSAVEGIE